MSDDQQLTGRGGPGRGQGRKTNEEKGLEPIRQSFNCKLPPDVIDEIRDLAAQLGLSQADLIIEALELYKAQLKK